MLVGIGGWFISMRSLVSNIVTDDHVVYAELAACPRARSSRSTSRATRMLPQLTGLALSLGNIFGGAVIIEFLFNYPGMGRLLIAGIYRGRLQPRARGDDDRRSSRVAAAVFVIDILYPLIDPRVKLG